MYLQGIGERIQSAVAEGKLSEEDGWAKWREVKDIDEESETAAVVITVFNKYQAAFRAGVAE